MPVKLDECTIPDELARYHVVNLFEENGLQVLLRSIENAFKLSLLSLLAEQTAQQELEHLGSQVGALLLNPGDRLIANPKKSSKSFPASQLKASRTSVGEA